MTGREERIGNKAIVLDYLLPVTGETLRERVLLPVRFDLGLDFELLVGVFEGDLFPFFFLGPEIVPFPTSSTTSSVWDFFFGEALATEPLLSFFEVN